MRYMSIVCNLSMLVRKKTEKRKEKKEKIKKLKQTTITPLVTGVAGMRTRTYLHTNTPHNANLLRKELEEVVAEICLTFSIQVLG